MSTNDRPSAIGQYVHFIPLVGARVCVGGVIKAMDAHGVATLRTMHGDTANVPQGWDAPYRGSWHPVGTVCERVKH